MSLLFLTPLLFTLIVGLASAFFMMRKKAFAQSLCVRQGVKMQNDLGHELQQLLALNSKAHRLRLRRARAEQRLVAATASAQPALIAAARAWLLSVVAEQLILRAHQHDLLKSAERLRLAHEIEMRHQIRIFRLAGFRSERGWPKALAVTPWPPQSLTPDYRELPDFSRRQRHQFRFIADLSLGFEPPSLARDLKQAVSCTVSLRKGEKSWTPKILAASA